MQTVEEILTSIQSDIKEYFKSVIDNTDNDVDCVLEYNKQICEIIDNAKSKQLVR